MRNIFLYFIISNNKIRKILTPISVIKTSLIKFCPRLPSPRKQNFLAEHDKARPVSGDIKYHHSVEADSNIEIQEMHCLNCGSRLKKNGYTHRKVTLDDGLGKLGKHFFS